VRVDYASGSSRYFVVRVGTNDFNACWRAAHAKQIPCPAKGYEGKDCAVRARDIPNPTVVTSMDDVVQHVLADAANGPIDLVLAEHGCECQFTINARDRVSLNPADSTNLRKLCNLRGKIKSFKLVACSVAHGECGLKFICAL